MILLFMLMMVLMDMVRMMAHRLRKSSVRQSSGRRAQSSLRKIARMSPGADHLLYHNCMQSFTHFPISHFDLSLFRRPACEVSEKMECVENTVSQCSFETRLGDTGEEEQVEVG